MRTTCALPLAMLALAGCNSDDERVDVDGLRDEPGLPMYYAGESFEGLPLTHAGGYGAGGTALFTYGTCEPPEGEGGCSPPIAISQSEFQRVHWVTEHRCLPGRKVRGVPAAWADGLVLFTGDLRLTIHARTRDEAMRVAAALRGVNRATTSADALPQQTPKARRRAAEACA